MPSRSSAPVGWSSPLLAQPNANDAPALAGLLEIAERLSGVISPKAGHYQSGWNASPARKSAEKFAPSLAHHISCVGVS